MFEDYKDDSGDAARVGGRDDEVFCVHNILRGTHCTIKPIPSRRFIATPTIIISERSPIGIIHWNVHV